MFVSFRRVCVCPDSVPALGGSWPDGPRRVAVSCTYIIRTRHGSDGSVIPSVSLAAVCFGPLGPKVVVVKGVDYATCAKRPTSRLCCPARTGYMEAMSTRSIIVVLALQSSLDCRVVGVLEAMWVWISAVDLLIDVSKPVS